MASGHSAWPAEHRHHVGFAGEKVAEKPPEQRERKTQEQGANFRRIEQGIERVVEQPHVVQEKARVQEREQRVRVLRRIVAVELPAALLSGFDQRLLREDVPVIRQVQRVHVILGVLDVDRRGVRRADHDHAARLDQAIEGLEQCMGARHVFDHVLRKDAIVSSVEHRAIAEVGRVLVEAGDVIEPARAQVARKSPLPQP